MNLPNGHVVSGKKFRVEVCILSRDGGLLHEGQW